MLTPAEIKNIAFKRSFSGYNYEEVDAFIGQVVESYEELYTENAQLLSKLDVLIERVEKYRDEEEMLKCAIINAQKMGDSIIRNAHNKAELLLAEAQIKCEKVEEKCRLAAKQKQDEFEQLQRSITDFKDKLLSTYKMHLAQIKELPSFDGEEQNGPTENQNESFEEPPIVETESATDFACQEVQTDKQKDNDSNIEDKTEQCFETVAGEEQDSNTDSNEQADEPLKEVAPLEGDTMEFSVDLPLEEQNDDIMIESCEETIEREIFFGADYKIEPDEDNKKGLFGRKR